MMHYQRNRRGLPMSRKKGHQGGTCKAKTCDTPSRANGYCAKCNARRKRGLPLGPKTLPRRPAKKIGTIAVHKRGNTVYHRIKTAKGWIPLSRHRMALKLGRKLRRNELVYHKNGDLSDFRPSNLLLHRKPRKRA